MQDAAAHLVGLDTLDTDDLIKAELEENSKYSVFSIGSAGENLVRFAVICGDKGHVASKNGMGAVMGSKKLKAIAAYRGENRILIAIDVTLIAIDTCRENVLR